MKKIIFIAILCILLVGCKYEPPVFNQDIKCGIGAKCLPGQIEKYIGGQCKECISSEPVEIENVTTEICIVDNADEFKACTTGCMIGEQWNGTGYIKLYKNDTGVGTVKRCEDMCKMIVNEDKIENQLPSKVGDAA